MFNSSCPQTVLSQKWDCLAKIAGADMKLFVSLREDLKFCPGKRGWSKWRCLAKLAGAKFKKRFGGLHKKLAGVAKKLKSKSKPLVDKIKQKASGLVGKLKKKKDGGAKSKVVASAAKAAKKKGKKAGKFKNIVKAGAVGSVVNKAKNRIKQGPKGSIPQEPLKSNGRKSLRNLGLRGVGRNSGKFGKGSSVAQGITAREVARKSAVFPTTLDSPVIDNLASPYETAPI